MTVKAACLIRLDPSISLTEREELIEMLRTTAYPIPGANLRDIFVSWEAEDAWNLRGLVEGTIVEVAAMYDGYVEFPERQDVREGGGNTNLGEFSWWVEV